MRALLPHSLRGARTVSSFAFAAGAIRWPGTSCACHGAEVMGLRQGASACNLGTLDVGKVKGCLWIDPGERVVEPQGTHEEPQAVTAGGFRTIQSVSKLLRGEHFSLRSTEFHSQCNGPGFNSEKLLGFGALFFGTPLRRNVRFHTCWRPVTPADTCRSGTSDRLSDPVLHLPFGVTWVMHVTA